MIEGEWSAVPQRWWTAAAAGKPLAASSLYNLRHKPDVALVNVIGDKIMSLTGPDGWSKVNALCEMSITNLSGNITIEGTLQNPTSCSWSKMTGRLILPYFSLVIRSGFICSIALACTVLLHL